MIQIIHNSAGAYFQFCANFLKTATQLFEFLFLSSLMFDIELEFFELKMCPLNYFWQVLMPEKQ